MSDGSVRAKVIEVDGQYVLDDPDALAVWKVVQKHNCTLTLERHRKDLLKFEERLRTGERDPKEFVIVLINVDDRHGNFLADLLMPEHDWNFFRDQGLVPYARGLGNRKAMTEVAETFDKEAAEKLRTLLGPVVLIVDFEVAEVVDVGA